MRLDKMLSNLGYGSRNDIKKYCKQGRVKVNEKTIKKSDVHVDENKDIVEFDGEIIRYRKYIYLMMNKPHGVVSATFDKYDDTVIDLIDYEYKVFEPFPVGRLDKDTEGLLVITNDGALSHRVLSPKRHVPKVYLAYINREIDGEDIEAFEKGININDEYITKPAKLKIVNNNPKEVEVTIVEGKYHQVKRMFKARGKNVEYLKRIKMGGLVLDENLPLGEYREMSEDEIKMLEE